MDRNYRIDIDDSILNPKVDRSILKRNIALDKILVKLDEYQDQVSEFIHSYNKIEAAISQALTDLLTPKEKLLDDLIYEIYAKIKEINDIKRDSSEEGDVLITKYKTQKLSGLLPNYQDLQPTDLHQIMHQLNQHLNISSKESELQTQSKDSQGNYDKTLRKHQIEQERLIQTIQDLQSEYSSKESELQSIIESLQTQLNESQGRYDRTQRNHQVEQKRLGQTIQDLQSESKHLTQQLQHPTPHHTLPTHPSPQLLNTLQGHTSHVWSVFMSADGRWIVSGSEDNSVRLWSIETKSQEATLQGHISDVRSVFMSADSMWIVSGSEDNSVRLWSVKTKSQEAIFQGHTASVNSVCMSIDNRWIVSGSHDNLVRLWSFKTKSQVAILQGHTSYVYSVCMSADSRWIVSGSHDTSVRLWNVETKFQEAILQGHTSYVYSVCMSADNRWIVSGSRDKSVRLWSVETKSQEAILQGHTSHVWSVCMSADSRWIVSGSGATLISFWRGDYSVRLWSVETKTQVAILQGHTDAVKSVCMSSDSRWIVSGSRDTSVRLWRLYEGK